MFGSSKSWGLNSTHLHGTHVPVEEPSTASIADIDHPLDPNIILGRPISALMTCIKHPARLDQQKFDLVLGIRLVLNALRHDETFRQQIPVLRHRENRSA